MSLDLATALYLADKLDRPDCAKARGIIKREIATAKLKEEMIPACGEIWECCKLVIKAGLGVAVVFGILWMMP